MDHIPVLLKEVIEIFNPSGNKIYLDSTFGAGGHSKALLQEYAKVYACDTDYSTKQYAEILEQEFPDKFYFFHKNFTEIADELSANGILELDGILMDLGVSSMQLDDPERGFSFMRDGDLDMRMDRSCGISAMRFINSVQEKELADIIYNYSDEVKSRTIAHAIVKYRRHKKIESTLELAGIIRQIVPSRKIDGATKTFQAIRMHVNSEVQNLIIGLQQLVKILKINGKLAVITFHSTEDRIVKRFFQTISKKNKHYTEMFGSLTEEFYQNYEFNMMDEIIIPSDFEIQQNSRARSAKLRVAERVLH